MARKKIKRKVGITHVRIAEFEMQDGQPVIKELPMETLVGNIDKERAEKIIKKSLPNATVLEVEYEESNYEIDTLDFIEYARKIEKE